MRHDRLVVMILAAGILGCSGVNGDAGNIRDPNGPVIEPPDGSGFIQVTVATAHPVSGASYTVTISNGQKQTADPNATLSFTTRRTGTHEVSLSSVPAECAIDGNNPVTVNVHTGEHVNVSFTVACPGSPASADLR